MPTIKTDDGVSLYYEEAGSGLPLLFVHEFAGDCRSWEPQVRALSRRYRCITYNARGWPPSDVPDDAARYSQDRARDDVLAVLDGLEIDKAHIVGLSMGGFATLHFGLAYPERALSLLIAGCGYGAEREQSERFRAEADFIAAKLREDGMQAFAAKYSQGPTRVQFENKDPRGFAEFATQLADHSAIGAAHTQQQIQKERPSIYDLEEPMRKLTVPTLIVTGDEDWPCLAPNVFMKQVIPSAGLVVVPNTGHTVNLEECELFNSALDTFLAQVDAGRWPMRDPRAVSKSITGMK
ncbi:MAG: pimeloyl-ACP methyl ester carboxylesterase [Gammaproteobacteria bacterium]|jgi:pimeloyl-ACP methyl ester carboxylesterase